MVLGPKATVFFEGSVPSKRIQSPQTSNRDQIKLALPGFSFGYFDLDGLLAKCESLGG
jgi:hypothetical protein